MKTNFHHYEDEASSTTQIMNWIEKLKKDLREGQKELVYKVDKLINDMRNIIDKLIKEYER